jgi:hypothetical protein
MVKNREISTRDRSKNAAMWGAISTSEWQAKFSGPNVCLGLLGRFFAAEMLHSFERPIDRWTQTVMYLPTSGFKPMRRACKCNLLLAVGRMVKKQIKPRVASVSFYREN